MYNKNEKHDKNIANDPNDGNEMKQTNDARLDKMLMFDIEF